MNFFPGKEEKRKEQLIEEIILKKYTQYYRLAYSYVHNEEDAADIVQNTAYKALRGCKDLRNTEYAETWLYRILLNEIFRVLKQPQTVSYEEFVEKTGNESESAEDKYEDMDLQRVLDFMEAKDKLVVELRYFEDRKLADIALLLNENVSTVKSRLYRSLQKMKIKLEE